MWLDDCILQVTVKPARLYERTINMLPHEVWAIIFEHLPADERISIMWSLFTRCPVFAFVFSHVPHLWMDWVIRSGCRRHQPPATAFAVRLWRKLHRNGRSIPITVHAASLAVRTGALSYYLPAESLPFIKSLNLRLSPLQFVDRNLHGFLSGIGNLTSLGLSLCETYPDFDSTPLPNISYPITRPVIVAISSLTSLTLYGIFFDKPTIEQTYFASLVSLHLHNIRLRPSRMNPSIFGVLSSAPFLQELTVRTHWVYRRSQAALYAPPTEAFLKSWVCRLQVVDIEGERGDVVRFMDILLRRPDTRFRCVRLALFCHVNRRDGLFQELPSLIGEIVDESDALNVNVDRHSFTSRWITPCGVAHERCIEWRMYDQWQEYWVDISVFRLSICLMNSFRQEICVLRFPMTLG